MSSPNLTARIEADMIILDYIETESEIFLTYKKEEPSPPTQQTYSLTGETGRYHFGSSSRGVSSRVYKKEEPARQYVITTFDKPDPEDE